jgi:polysaccharide export outer membrane protein
MPQPNPRVSAIALGLLLALAAASGAALAVDSPSKAAARNAASPVEPRSTMQSSNANRQVAAVATQSRPAAVQEASALEAVGPGDMVRINVFRNPELTTETRVTDQGTIFFPLIGEVTIAGLSPQQASRRIADLLASGKFVVSPEVQLSIATVNSRQVSVLGNVAKPGRYPIDSVNRRVTDFIAAAGGMAATGADAVTVVQMRNGAETKTDVDLEQMFRNGKLASNLELAPGDTIYVHRAPMIYVGGEVNKAGAYRLEPHMTVMQAIALGGGINPRGTERGVRIHRKDGNGAVRKIDAGMTDAVRADDVIYVRESLF